MKKRAVVLKCGRFLQLVKDGRWEYVERVNAHGAVAIVAVSRERLILTEQFRVPVGRIVIDLPAGLAGDEPGTNDEPLLESARRELLEETGFASDDWQFLDHCPSSPGLTSEVISYFLAQNARSVARGGGVDHEQITVHKPKIAKIEKWLDAQRRKGKMIDVKVYAALHFIDAMTGLRSGNHATQNDP